MIDRVFILIKSGNGGDEINFLVGHSLGERLLKQGHVLFDRWNVDLVHSQNLGFASEVFVEQF